MEALAVAGKWIAANSTALTAASSVATLATTMAATSAQASAQRVQAAQAELQGRQNALNYSRQASAVLNRQQQLAATARARAAAGGVDPFTGSPLTIQQVDSMRAGEEFSIAQQNAQTAIYGGLAQSQNLMSAAELTQGLGTLRAVSEGVTGAARVGRLMTPSKEV